ncbi:MAG: hypothetical protein P1Q69_01580 [Candidatus Thorarchaeota archaeon]|nr:hypothetical protein [Candidatus Thorarchaeota archaeon]
MKNPTRRTRTYLIGFILLCTPLVISLAFIHDNPQNITSIASINSVEVTVGMNVTVKGKITEIMFYYIGINDQVVHMSDGEGNVTFYWDEFRLEVGWTIIVSGVVYSDSNINPVVYVEKVLLFF